MIRLTIPSIEEDDFQAVRAVLETGYLVQGPQVAAFEEKVADFVGVHHAVAVSNGTAALHLALLALDIGPGDLVITTTYSWPATANVIELCGAQPIFVDIDPNTFNIDPNQLETKLNEVMSNPNTAKRVKAILPIHAFGLMADMPTILTLAEKFGIPVVEDAACALGAAIDNQQAGSWGIMGCFSFHPRKAITTGEGGIITTNNASLARRLRALRNHGQDPEAPTTDFIFPGYNYRMTEFQAALGGTQMNKVERIILARQQAAALYDQHLDSTAIQAPIVPDGYQSVFQSYVVILPPKSAEHRQQLIKALREQGIETTIGTWHMPLVSYYRSQYGFEPGDYPVTDDVFARSLTLPLYEGLKSSDQQQVTTQLVEQLSEICDQP
jgi:dTDP-4-amino-4,6-dideoxygalactose transaminase